jgi:hypothetical protein
MRDSLLLLGDGQDFVNNDTTGEVTDNVLDLELLKSGGDTPLTDDQAIGYMNVEVTATSYSSGGTEGICLEVHTGDNSDLTTGAKVIGHLDVPLASIVAGAKFSVPFRKDVADRYLGGWVLAKSTTYTGTFYLDLEFSNLPISENESLQKVTA